MEIENLIPFSIIQNDSNYKNIAAKLSVNTDLAYFDFKKGSNGFQGFGDKLLSTLQMFQSFSSLVRTGLLESALPSTMLTAIIWLASAALILISG